MAEEARQSAVELFRRSFGAEPEFVVRSPGRVNLIGDHTDYNDGFVLPMAIDRSVWLAGRMTTERRIRVESAGFDVIELDLDRIERSGGGWGEYVAGVAWSLAEAGDALCGWDGAVASDVPVGAGLSSSAALELAVARATTVCSGSPWDPVAIAQVAQRAENEWVGMACGIMDQLVVAAAAPHAALLIDCRWLETRPVPIPTEVAVVVVDSATRRSLVGSAYNQRRKSCEQAAALLGVPALRDIEDVGQIAALLPERLARRARHVVTENRRVLAFEAALRDGDVEQAGQLLLASHRSLRDDFEVSVPEIDDLVATLMEIRGVHGARMTGAGFGGCLVALVDAASVGSVIDELRDRVHPDVEVYVTRPAAGTSFEPL